MLYGRRLIKADHKSQGVKKLIVPAYHISQESQAIDVSRLKSPSIVADALLILQPSPSKQTTAYTMMNP